MASSPTDNNSTKPFSLLEAYALIRAALSSSSQSPLSTSPSPLPKSLPTLPHLPKTGLGPVTTLQHILNDLVPTFHPSATSPNFYAFVTGGVLPIAEAADLIVGAWDQNVQVHWPEVMGGASHIEWWAGGMLGEVLGLNGEMGEWGREGEREGKGGDDRGGEVKEGVGRGLKLGDGVGVESGQNREGIREKEKLEKGQEKRNEGNREIGKGKMETKERWRARTFTTGATASNILGLACAREAILQRHLDRISYPRKIQDEDPNQDHIATPFTVSNLGLLKACSLADITDFQILTSLSHSSISKAASTIGLGRSSIIDIGLKSQPWRLDLQKIEDMLKIRHLGTIVVVGCGEVNTGRFSTGGREEMQRIRDLCDEFGGWLHVDGAFGLFARVLPTGEEFDAVKKGTEGIELAHSITGDCHKLLNVAASISYLLSTTYVHEVLTTIIITQSKPYDCGFFFTHSVALLESIFQNPAAAYLSPSSTSSSSLSEPIPSPLHIGIENSRRFRALPVYAVLLSHGLSGLQDLFVRQVNLARSIATFISQHSGYELLPQEDGLSAEEQIRNVHIIVLFRAKDLATNRGLAGRINRLGRMVVSGTKWREEEAVRIAVATWMVDEVRDAEVVRGVLEEVLL